MLINQLSDAFQVFIPNKSVIPLIASFCNISNDQFNDCHSV